MFYAKPHDYLPEGIKKVGSGHLLGRWGHPLTFEITSDAVKKPFFIHFHLVRGVEGELASLTKSDIQGESLTVNLINLPKRGTLGTTARPSLISLEKHGLQLTVSFVVQTLNNAEYFVFLYEFYEEPLTPSTDSTLSPTTEAAE